MSKRVLGLAGLLLLVQSLVGFALEPGDVKWTFDAGFGEQIYSTPAIGPDGTIYFATADRGNLHALNPDGSVKWTFQTNEFTRAAPTIGPDGTIYIGTFYGSFFAVSSAGEEKWKLSLGPKWRITHQASLGEKGTVYFRALQYNDFEPMPGVLYAVNPDGSVKWSKLLENEDGNGTNTAVSIARDGVIYLPDFGLQALYPNGDVKWSAPLEGWIHAPPAIGADGTVYFGAGGSEQPHGFYAFHPDGTEKWRFSEFVGYGQYEFHSAPTIGPDGTIYFGYDDGYLYAVNPDGTTKWRLRTNDSDCRSSPTIAADGTIYVTQTGWTELLAINPDGSFRWRSDFGDRFRSSPALGPDGTLYAADYDGEVRAFYSGVGGLADSAWPTLGQNSRRIGRNEEWDVTPLELEIGSTFTTSTWDVDRFSIEVDEGRDLLVEAKPGDGVVSLMLDVGFGEIVHPNVGTFTVKTTNLRGSYDVLISPTQSGTYFISVLGTEVEQEGGNYEITARYYEEYVSDLEPRSVGNGGLASLSVRGLQFEPGMTIELSGPGLPSLRPYRVSHVSSTELLALFDFTGEPVGVYDLTVAWPEGFSERLEGSFTVEPGNGPRLEVRIRPSRWVRPGRKYTGWLRIENKGDADAPAPLLSLRSNVPISLRSDVIKGQRVEILGVGSLVAPEVIRAGEARSIPFHFFMPTIGTQPEFEVFLADDSEAPVDWEEQKEIMRPPGMDPVEWETLWPDLVVRFGTIWADYLAVLRADATRLAARGELTHDVREIIAFEARQARGLPVAAIAGTLHREGSDQPLGGVLVRAISLDGEVVREATTASQPGGHFVIENLPSGIYELYVEGYFFDPTPIVDVIADDVIGLMLDANEYPLQPDPEEIGTPRHDPSVARSETGELFMVWEEDGEIWWAREDSGSWEGSSPIPDALGVNPKIIYDSYLLDGGASPGLLVAWESIGNPTVIDWVAGRPTAEAIDWSAPRALTGDSFDDFEIAMASDGSGTPLIVWLQRDLLVDDDSDLYFGYVDVGGVEILKSTAYFPSQDSAIGSKYTACLGVPGLEITKTVPKYYPLIGGRYRVGMYGQACVSGTCELGMEGAAGLIVELGDYVSGEGEFNVAGNWTTDRKSCEYVISTATVSGGFEFELFPWVRIPIPLVGGLCSAKVGAVFGVSVIGTMTWKGGFSGWPDMGELRPAYTGGVQGVLDCLEGGLTGEVKGAATVNSVYRPFQGLRFEGQCLRLEGTIKAGWGLWEITWEKAWGSTCDDVFHIVGGFSVLESTEKRFATVDSYALDEVLVSESFVYEKIPFVGTGAIYEGMPVLGDISGDLLNDGSPSLARSEAGEVVVVWPKDQEADFLGARLFASTLGGGGWSEPVEITAETDFVKDPAVVFDGSGSLMTVWSSASNSGLDYDLSTVEEIVAATEIADLAYAVRTGGVWSMPAIIAELTGTDESPVLAAGPAGEIVVVWLNRVADETVILASFWDGAVWSEPAAIASAVAVDPPTVIYVDVGPVVLWAQDGDADINTFDDWVVKGSRWGGVSWSTPEMVNEEKEESRHRVSSSTLRRQSVKSIAGTPPQECCEEEEPPSPLPPETPGKLMHRARSLNIWPWDPNEKIPPQGSGDQHLIQAGDELPYEVHFENLATATAPAQEVVILDCLDPDLDWLNFRLDEVAFSDTIVVNKTTAPVFSEKVTIQDYRPGVEKQWWVDVGTSFNLLSGCFRTTLRQLDPETGELPADPFAGILAPEDGTGRGQGHLSYSVNTKGNLEDGVVISNRASIIFDVNEPILTNEVFNTIGEPQFRLLVSTVGDGAGSVTSTPAGIDCGDVCEWMYIEGTIVELNHFAEDGSEFTEWGGDADCGDGVVTMSAGVACTATFVLVANEPPVADAGIDQVLSANDQCEAEAVLDGSLSYDPDDDPLTYLWQSQFGEGHEAIFETVLPLGEHEFTLTVADDSDESASDVATVTVEDGMGPAITLNGEAEVTLECKQPYTELGAAAEDNCEGEVEVVIGGDQVDPGSPGSFVLTYDATDTLGNQAEQMTRSVSVVDTEGPAVSCRLSRLFVSRGNNSAGLYVARYEAKDACTKSSVPRATVSCGGAPKTIWNRQLLVYRYDDECKIRKKWGVVSVQGPFVEMSVTATDTDGNTGTCSTVLVGGGGFE